MRSRENGPNSESIPARFRWRLQIFFGLATFVAAMSGALIPTSSPAEKPACSERVCAGGLVLEEYEHAKARGAKIYAELTGYGMSADAYHITAPYMDGPRRSMVNALKNAGIAPSDVQYLNAHGTSTPLGDKNESDAVKAAFGDHAGKLVVNTTGKLLTFTIRNRDCPHLSVTLASVLNCKRQAIQISGAKKTR